jgi:hypothetical protein
MEGHARRAGNCYFPRVSGVGNTRPLPLIHSKLVKSISSMMITRAVRPIFALTESVSAVAVRTAVLWSANRSTSSHFPSAKKR